MSYIDYLSGVNPREIFLTQEIPGSVLAHVERLDSPRECLLILPEAAVAVFLNNLAHLREDHPQGVLQIFDDTNSRVFAVVGSGNPEDHSGLEIDSWILIRALPLPRDF